MGKHGRDPLRELLGVKRRMNQLFENAIGRTDFDAGSFAAWSPAADVEDTAEALQLALELPGLQQDSIEVKVEGTELVVEGQRPPVSGRPGRRFHRVERSYGAFSRRFALPPTVDRERIEAHYRLGVLHVRLPKKGAGTGGIKVPIA